MSATRSRKEELAYKKYRATQPKDYCVFCDKQKMRGDLVEDAKYFRVIKNTFAYSLWDSQRVSDHLMIVPRKHTDSHGHMTDKEKIEYVDLVQKYEQRGYNIYARAPGSGVKSVVHQHTHLIKTYGDVRRFVLLLRRPYIRILFR